jgi:hypothetical protein
LPYLGAEYCRNGGQDQRFIKCLPSTSPNQTLLSQPIGSQLLSGLVCKYAGQAFKHILVHNIAKMGGRISVLLPSSCLVWFVNMLGKHLSISWCIILPKWGAGSAFY